MEATKKHTPKKLDFNPEDLTTIKKFAKSLGLSRTAIYYWIKIGKIREVNYLGERWVDTSTYTPKPEDLETTS